MARGEFTTIIDSDDFFAPNGLELLVRHWDEIPAAERPSPAWSGSAPSRTGE